MKKSPAASQRHRRLKPWTLPAAGIITVCLLTGWCFAAKYWPYRYREVQPLLQNVFASQIKIEKYHRIYFPNPGFVASGLTLRRDAAQTLPPVGSARALIVRGRWVDLLLLRHRVQLVDVVGLHVTIPPVGSAANHADFPSGSTADFAGPTTAVEELHLHDAILEIQRTNGGSYNFPIRDLVIRNLQRGRTISYAVDMQNAIPTGHILSKGTFGPLNPSDLGSTPLSGDFTFSQVALSDIGSLHGQLYASDHFDGTVRAIEARATSSTPDFAVSHGSPTPLNATVRCTINALNGEILLHAIEAKIGASTLRVQGTILGSPKLTNLDFQVDNGRVQDLMHPFLHDRVPVVGAVWMHGHARLSPARNNAPFLQRLHVDGVFHVPAERLTNRATEKQLTAFSQRAQGNKSGDPDETADAISSLGGPVTIANGVASTPRLTFQIPGAAANLTGTYSFTTTQAHLTGTIQMDTGISHVTTGFKSILLKPLTPFFRKGTSGAVIPIAITGSSHQYKITQNIFPKK